MNLSKLLLVAALIAAHPAMAASADGNKYVFEAGHPSLRAWLLPEHPTYPESNAPTPARVALGERLFFDARLSGDKTTSCASCHNPMYGWSDGLPTAVGFKSKVLPRATPTILNAAYNSIQMWDGRAKTLEDQAVGPMDSRDEMRTDWEALLKWMGNDEEYRQAFEAAYPDEGVSKNTVAKAIASYERTVISRNSPFDRWVRGDKDAMSAEQVLGFKVFVAENKGNCASCHQAPNFTDDGFHNIGLESFRSENADLGRYEFKPIGIMKGAFKTPTLRGISLTAPYFHDGSATTLQDVVEHYVRGGDVKTHLSPNMKSLELSDKEKRALVAFMRALSSRAQQVALPSLPIQ